MTDMTRQWGGRPYHSLDFEMKRLYGGKVYRLSLQTGCSCPNRDGKKGRGGCIFCSEGGSGEFASRALLPVQEQISAAKARVSAKLGKDPAGYIAYFQSFSNTYGDPERLEKLFLSAQDCPDILALSIATRPDCISEEMYGILEKLNRRKPVWIELGLQTIHESTAGFIRRGYTLRTYEEAAVRLKTAGISVVTHIIEGLPFESEEMMLETAEYLASLRDGAGRLVSDGIKIHLLHVLQGTELGRLYETGKLAGGLHEFTLDEYVDHVIDIIEMLPEEMVIHRMTGDAPKSLLIAPLWSADKKRVLNAFTRRFAERGSFQGKRYREGRK